MSGGEKISVEGLPALIKAIKAIDPELTKELKVIGKVAAEPVARVARSLVPQSSGALLGTIRTGATLKSGTVKAGKKAVPYANPIHWGWQRKHIRPQPFLLNALDHRRDEVFKTYEDGLTKLCDEIWGKAS